MQRIRTAICVILPLLAALWAGGAYLLALAIMVCAMAQWEFYSMFWPGSHRPFKTVGVVLGATLLIVVFWQDAQLALALIGLSFFASALLFLANWGRNTLFDAPQSFILLCGILYIPFLLGFAGYFSAFEQLLLIATAALSDTAAYFVGIQYGSRKIWPSVSPKKSVEGALGGLCASVLVCTLAGAFRGTASLWLFPLLGLYLGIAAQLGDFFESALKRSCAVKDSGGLLPGHGGILDRIDSLLFVIPAYMAISALIPFFSRLP